MSQQFDDLGKPLSGGLLYFIEAGTTSTPQNAYQDSALTIAHSNPLTLDSAGRVPQFYLADGSIKIRLTNSAGVQQLVADNVLVVGPSSGSGGGGSVDATTVLATGDIKVKYGTGTLSGFVRANGRTIGSATSGATERANADTQSLFEYLWGADANLSVSSGRGASANADWTANKTIALPDWRGRAIAGLDDMGNTAASRLSSTYFGTDATVLGAAGGSEKQTLTQAQLPAVSPTFTGTAGDVTVLSTANNIVRAPGSQTFQAGSGGSVTASGFSSVSSIGSTGTFTPSGTISALGSGNAHPIASPMMLATIFIKL
jgi:microcystin-dependent protein